MATAAAAGVLNPTPQHPAYNATTTATDLRLGDHLAFEWNGLMIVVSYIIAVQAAYVAMTILQLRLSPWMVVLSALNLSVSGIWSMHFIGMGAMSTRVAIGLDVGLTILSAFMAFIPCVAALLIVHYKVPPMPVAGGDVLSVRAHVHALLKAPHRWLVLSAVMIAAGVCGMHYCGMRALDTTASLEVQWRYIILSVLIALFAATAALYFAFIFPLTRTYAAPTAVVAGVAVCGMHYTGMYGMAWIVVDGTEVVPSGAGGDNALVAVSRYIICAAMLVPICSLAVASYIYRGMIRQGALKMERAVHTAGSIAESLAVFDLEAAEEALMGTELPPALDRAYADILRNLQRYRPYLPDALFAELDQERDENGPACEDTTALMQQDTGVSTEVESLGSSRSSRSERRPQAPPGQGSFANPAAGGSGNPGAATATLHQKIASLVMFSFDLGEARNASVYTAKHSASLAVVMQAVKGCGGSLDWFQGNHMSASFNAFRRISTHATGALRAALKVVAKGRQSDAVAPCDVAVASGVAHVGTLGTSTLLSPSLVGDMPSIVAQMVRAAPLTGTTLLTSPKIYKETEMEFAQDALLHKFVFADVAHPHDARVGMLYSADAALEDSKVCAMGTGASGECDEWMYELARKENPNRTAVNDAAQMLHAEGVEPAVALLVSRGVPEDVRARFEVAAHGAGTFDFGVQSGGRVVLAAVLSP